MSYIPYHKKPCMVKTKRRKNKKELSHIVNNIAIYFYYDKKRKTMIAHIMHVSIFATKMSDHASSLI